ncbi:hypothetical protein G7046_g80 [Stylonectria norvegica]|nr:hypothetical protein G7046_g80 [Stylonectria norvegica]
MPYNSPFVDVEFPLVDVWSMYMEGQREYPDDHRECYYYLYAHPMLLILSRAPFTNLLPAILVDGETNRSYTFAQIKDRSITFGRGLKHALQWRKSDVLAFFTPNNIDIPVVNLGLLWAGGVASPANPTYTPEELARQLDDSKARALITQKRFLQTACKAAELAGLPLSNVYLLGDERDEQGKFGHWSDLTAKEAWFPPRKPSIDPKKDLAYLVYSSGTTGLPKGVMLTHYNMVANSYQSRRFDAKGLNWDHDAQLGVLPFFHIYGLAVVLNVTLVTGAKCVLMSKFDLAKACQLIQDNSLTFIYVPPPIILALGKHPIVSEYDLSSLRFINSAAAPLSKDLVDAVWKRLQVAVKQGYGLTETSPTVTTQLMDEWAKFQGSVGKLCPNMQAKIVDAEGKEMPEGESGELLLKGPNIFQGYYNKPQLDKETFTEDGWYKTGDVMFICPKGNFYITDRLKELIKYKGFQVPPAELEAKLIGRTDVADVCVIGIWNEEEHTEVPRAYVMLAPGVEESDQLAGEIIEWLNARVGPPKRLRGGVRFVKEIPKSQAGKILRRVLREQVRKAEKEEKSGLRAKL